MNDLGYKIILAVVVILVLGVIGYYVWYEPTVEVGVPESTTEPTATASAIVSSTPLPVSPSASASPDGEPVFCTQDAMQCPDGSFVGRIPPNCEFAPCPGN